MIRRISTVVLSLAMSSGAVFAADMPQYKLTIKDHKFEPAQIAVPAGVQFKVLVSNQDSTPSEFESNDFNREKIVLPNSEITVFIGPLDKGHYKFFDDFHQDTGQGVIVAQ